MSPRLARGAVASAFARSFLIQGSWNYHTMIGSGFAFAVLPVLRSLYGHDPGRLEESVGRHLEHFNAHPYLAGVALGAVARMEADGADPEAVRRFKVAVRGPLGSLGDALVWAAWLPAVAAAALAIHWLGAPPWAVVAFFLLAYNVAHFALRLWGFRTGLRDGRAVGRSLAEADLAGLAERVRPVAVGALGVLTGVVTVADDALAGVGPLWTAGAAVAFFAGTRLGHALWRPTAVVVVVVVGALSIFGRLSP